MNKNIIILKTWDYYEDRPRKTFEKEQGQNLNQTEMEHYSNAVELVVVAGLRRHQQSQLEQ